MITWQCSWQSVHQAADAFHGNSWLSLEKFYTVVRIWRYTFKGPWCDMEDQHHKYKKQYMQLLFFRRWEPSKLDSLGRRRSYNMRDMEFLLESMTLWVILLKFSTHKTWKSQSKQKAQIQSRLADFPHSSKLCGLKDWHLVFLYIPRDWWKRCVVSIYHPELLRISVNRLKACC